MSSSDEEPELNYGFDDEAEENFQEEDYDPQLDSDKHIEPVEVPKFSKNPKLKSPIDDDDDEEQDVDEEANDSGQLEDLLNLIQQEDNEEEQEDEEKVEKEPQTESQTERKKFIIKKDKLAKQKTSEETNTSVQSQPSKTTPTPPTKIKEDEQVLREKHTGIRLIKSTFKSELDLNMHLSCDYGKYFKLTELSRRMNEIKDSKDMDWFSVFVIGSKTESKCSAKGNNYVIWQIFDLNNLDRQQEISLFLFGGAYKSHWKSNEFECFALIKPEFLDSNKNTSAPVQNQQKTPFVTIGGKKGAVKSDWNKFATKKINQTLKISLSVKSDSQLVKIGIAKDISNCQSYLKPNPNQQIQEATKKCKNLVNLEQAPFCVYHCVQMDKSKSFQSNKGKYSMDKPANRLGNGTMFPSSPSLNPQDLKFMPPISSSLNKYSDMEQKAKASKEIKAEIVRSLTSSITKESPILANIAYKTNKKSDMELLASLDGKELAQEEIKKIRLAEQATVRHQIGGDDPASKEIKKLFSSKLLLPNENNITSISSQKLVDLKKTNPPGILGQVKSNILPNSLRVKEKIEDNKKNFSLSAMSSHKDIVKQMKDNKDQKEQIEIEIETSKQVQTTPKIQASDFLQKRINEIKRFSSPASKQTKPEITPKKSNNDFDLELFIGDSVTSKKLMDVNSKYIPFSPSTATSEGYKRKLEEMSPGSAKKEETKEDKREKRLKLIQELQGIKSNHSKEANDPEKNPHLKAYYNRLELQDKVEEKLCNMRNREVRVVSCKVCSYTAFSQSEYCKLQKHEIRRHMVLQRFFKCRSCGKRSYTLDKVCPVVACSQCGSEKYEPCTMKEDKSSDVIVNKCTPLEQDSEMFLENE